MQQNVKVLQAAQIGKQKISSFFVFYDYFGGNNSLFAWQKMQKSSGHLHLNCRLN